MACFPEFRPSLGFAAQRRQQEAMAAAIS